MSCIKSKAVTPRFRALLGLPMFVPRPLGMTLAFFLVLLALSSPARAAVDNDPLEGFNRATHQFNRSVDRILFKPLAKTYRSLAPAPVRTGVKNFFSNLDDVRVTLNDVLQLKFGQAARDFGRLAVNSTVGIGGILDVATPALGLDKKRQDFGMTLAHYGVGSGPYLVLPLLGPSTLRDALALSVDAAVDPVPAVDHVETRNGLMASEAVDFRASVLNFDDLIIGDEYLFIRGAYLQQREYAIDGGYTEVAMDF